MLSITFALLRSYTALNFWQVMVAVMSLDITSATVQMALSQKDTLSSRWWVVLNATSQLLVHASIGVVLGNTFPISSAQQDPCQPCVRVIWWSIFDSCDKVPGTFWLYFALRTLLVLRSCAIGLHHMHFYDLGERIARGEKSSQEVSWSSHFLRLITFTEPIKHATIVHLDQARETIDWSPEAFPRMPATTLTDWILWTLPAVVAMSSLERMLSLFDLSNPGNIEDWGQTTTFMAVVCGLVARAIYLFYAKLKRRSCLGRTQAAAKLLKSSTAQKMNLSTEDFASLVSKCKSFRDIQQVLQPVDCVRWGLPEDVWYQHKNLQEAEQEFLRSAVLNDTNGLIEWAQYLPDISTAVDDMNRTALHLALEKNNIEAIETIMGLLNPEPQPVGSSATSSRNVQKLLNAPDKTQRTPWRMIMPAEYDQVNTKTLEAFLRFRYSMRRIDNPAPLSQIINMIFTLPYALEVMETWMCEAKTSQSSPQLEECIIQAVQTDNLSQDLRTGSSLERVYEFCGWQHDKGRTIFADKLFKAFVDSAGRCSWPMPEYIPSRLTEFVHQKQVWAMESYASITRIVATSGGDVADVKFLIEHHPQGPQIDEQILIGAVCNYKIRFDLTKMMLETWPNQVNVTPKVLEALLASSSSFDGAFVLRLLLTERPHQIQVTESMLIFVTQSQNFSTECWRVLLDDYRSQIKMTQHIFCAMIDTLFEVVEPLQPDDIDVFREVLIQWPSQTKITSPVLHSILRLGHRIDILYLLYELRRNELGAAIDGEVLIMLGQWSTKKENGTEHDKYRYLVNFFFERYPEECKASITNQVLWEIENRDKGSMNAWRTELYFRNFRRD